MTDLRIPYLADMDWYRAWFRAALGQGPAPVADGPPNRGVIRGAWGEQTLTVPIEGGRRRMARVPYARLRLSEHDGWRHKHWQAITSAYGALPYFHYFKDELAPAFSTAASLDGLCRGLHSAFVRCADLERLAAWLRLHPQAMPGPAAGTPVPGHVSAMELLLMFGPETVFHLI